MRQRLRPLLAAAVALLIGGDLAVRGMWESLDLWRFLFPFLWLFLAFEALNRRRRLHDFEAFLIGAAVGLFHDGVYVKVLQEGASFLGIDWLSVVGTAFDWGMVVVLALHVVAAFVPREEEPGPAGLPELGALVFLPAAAFCVYLLDTCSGRYRYDRMIGDTWLLADFLFLIAAGLLVRRAMAHAASDEAGEREDWFWPWAAFCVWLPGSQALGRLADSLPWPFILALVIAWAAVVAAVARSLWKERSYVDPTAVSRSKLMLGAAAWRVIGSLLVLLVWGPGSEDPISTFAFSMIVELPSLLVFSYAFLTGRLAV